MMGHAFSWGRIAPRMTTTIAPPGAVPTLTVYPDAYSTVPLLTMPQGGPQVYTDIPESATLRHRIDGLIAHEALPQDWERDAGALRDLGRLLAATYSVTFTERGQEYRVPKPQPELGWFFRTSLR